MARRAQRGVHFFRPVPKEYLHSAELRDIMQFGSSSQAVFFKMRVAGVLHIFQFDTRQARWPQGPSPAAMLGQACCSTQGDFCHVPGSNKHLPRSRPHKCMCQGDAQKDVQAMPAA